ncbi:MAG: hypothetical protein ACREHD_29390 [Pirellulales bacterium]
MSTPDDWAKGFGRQADADLRAWELYQQYPQAVAAECHKLLFLQMACEKLCKAHLIRSGIHKPEDVQRSHGFIQKHAVDHEAGNSQQPRIPEQCQLGYVANPATLR